MTTHATPATPDETLSQRRATAAAMKRDGSSLRAIGAALGVSKDTVKRDLLDHAAAVARQATEPPAPAHETPAPPVASRITAVADTALPQTLTMPTHPGHTVPIVADEEFLADLAVIVAAGRTPADAIGHAVHVLATIYRGAWAADAYPDGVEPEITGHQLAPYQG
ncbi:hypothetical protein ACFVWX_29050 [Streptomyces sp. NPDC058220]|uniref:hypothetical protein n=1 Tax=Streptomyces sp. NPDC058220 TaxID=3346387 RepID=UPI0036E0BE16